MMLRLLFWLVLAVLVVMAIRSKLRGVTHDSRAAAAPGRALGEGEAMACCAHCHVYFPASESVRADGLDYCSPTHVRLPPL
jgi:uncharacterized protein